MRFGRRVGLVAAALGIGATVASLVIVDASAQETQEGPPPSGAPHETADQSTPPPGDAPVDEPPLPDESELPVAVSRISGATRFETAAQLAMRFGTDGTVFVASGTGFADALAGGPVAGVYSAPILLVSSSEVPTETADALDALSPSDIVLLGGTGAVSEAVAEELGQWAPVERIAGDDRFETAALLADRGFWDIGADNVYIANGRSFADALSGGSRGASFSDGGPILLVDTDSVPDATRDAIEGLQPSTITILGGPGAVSDAVEADLSSYADVVRIAGADRYETSALVAEDLPSSTTMAFVATGVNYPDALAAAPFVGYFDGPTILVPPSGPLPDSTVEALQSLWSLDQVVAIGGTGALSDDVLEQLYAVVNGGAR
jgi:putative cell wall-binding protein